MIYYLAAFVSTIFYGTLAAMAKLIGQSVPNFALMTIAMSSLAITSIGASFIMEKNFSFSTITPQNWLLLIGFGLINFVGFSLNLFSYKGISVVEFQMISLLMPVIGGVTAYLFLGEQFHWRYLIGLMVMGAGLFIAIKGPGA